MTPPARVSAAIEVLADIEGRRRPAADALKDWGLSHRFAGSSDRAAIASLVYDGLRRRASARWLLEDEGPRATILGSLVLQRGATLSTLDSLFSGERFASEPLTDGERRAIETRRLTEAPDHVQADVPEWLWSRIAATFGGYAVAEAVALAGRAPLDLRANTLKTSRDKLLAELAPLGAAATPLSPLGLRIPPGPDGRGASVQSEPSFQKGWFEVQDEGSQIAGLASGARGGEQALDLCAGGGGKTLELAAMMGNKGQLYATDADKRRLAPIHARLARAGVRNAQVLQPRNGGELAELAGRLDLVVIDAPCTGSGTWRRNPDAKWRVRPNSLADRVRDQAAVLSAGAEAVRPGGRLLYITCSILPDENEEAVEAFLASHPEFAAMAPDIVASEAGLPVLAGHTSPGGHAIQLSPYRTGTDAFFIARLRRSE